MAAYAALVSVMQIIHQLERHPSPPISLDKQQVESLTEIVTFLQEFLEGYNSPFCDSAEADPLEMRIADAAHKAEDVIESEIVGRIRSRLTTHGKMMSFFKLLRGPCKSAAHGDDFYKDVEQVIEEMDLIKKEVMMEMMREKIAVQAEPQRNIFRSSSFTGKNGIMVGFDDALLQLLDKLTSGPLYRQVIPITGMGGIGKTTLARNIFENALIKEYFDICAWITISQQYSTKEILCQLLSQPAGQKSDKRDNSEEELGEELYRYLFGSDKSDKSEEELGEELYKYLFGRKYLIIMDDIWSIEVWEKMRFFFADCNNGSRIVVTTRQSYLTSQLTDSYGLHMEFLDEVNSWNLFSKTVFGKERFPLELETIGKKIVKNCRGLPLSIVVVGGLLAKSEHIHEHWEDIEQKLNSIVNSENDEYCLKVLKLSYNHLPASLKPSFLYMGIFVEDTQIRVATLIKLWVSEGFLKSKNGKSLETIGKEFLKELIDRNLILIDELGCTGNIKYCKIHDLLRDFCLKEAENERFYHVIGQYNPQGIHNRRRIFYPRRSSNERVLDALKSMSHVRSFTSQYDSVGVLPNFRLLRILNTHEVYEYPECYCLKDVIHELVNSRYVAINTSGKTKIPSSVNFLWNLHTLRIQVGKVATVEIWKMSQLRHAEFIDGGMYLPDPPSESSVILENLETLKGVVNFKCGEEVVKRIPNLKRLLIEYNIDAKIGRHHAGDYYSLSNLERLCKLESLTFNKYSRSDDLVQSLTFPHSLKKLSLVDRYSVGWEEMLEKIGSLPLLQKLKLMNGVFKTGKWKTVEDQFPSLKSLALEYCGLDQWMIEESSHFPCLEHLRLLDLNLEEIPAEIGEIPTLQSIELELCSDSLVKSAKKIVEEQEELQGEQLPFHVRVRLLDKRQEVLRSLANPNFKVE